MLWAGSHHLGARDAGHALRGGSHANSCNYKPQPQLLISCFGGRHARACAGRARGGAGRGVQPGGGGARARLVLHRARRAALGAAQRRGRARARAGRPHHLVRRARAAAGAAAMPTLARSRLCLALQAGVPCCASEGLQLALGVSCLPRLASVCIMHHVHCAAPQGPLHRNGTLWTLPAAAPACLPCNAV